jgi:hypothetical protein
VREFDSDGIFWLPESPEQKIAGRLTFSPQEGGELKLIGSFAHPTSFLESQSYPRIFGIASRKELTLDRCRVSNEGIEMPGIMRQEFLVGSVLAGMQLPSNAPLEFSSISVTIDNLEEWVGRSGTSVTFNPRQVSGRDVFGFVIEYEPMPHETSAYSNGEVELGFTYGLGGDHLRESRLTQGCFLRVRPSVPVNLYEELLPLALSFQDLVTLSINEAAWIDEITLTHPDVLREVGDRQVEVPIDLLFPIRGPAGVRSQRRRLAHDMILTLNDLGGVDGLARWLDLATELRPVIGLILSARYLSTLYEENRFLNMVGAAEAYHRLRCSNEVLPKAAFRFKKRRIMHSVPRDEKAWLQQQLQYSNEPRLSRRLEDLVDFAGDPLRGMVKSRRNWAKLIASARNKLIHHMSGQDIERSTGSNLYYLGESVFYLVVACILKELDESGALVGNLSRHSRFNFIASKIPDMPSGRGA